MKIIFLILTLLVSLALSAPLPYCNSDCLLRLIDRIPNAFEKTSGSPILPLKEMSFDSTANELTVIIPASRSDCHKESTMNQVFGDYQSNHDFAATNLKSSDNDQVTMTKANVHEHEHRIQYDTHDLSKTSEALVMAPTTTDTHYDDPTASPHTAYLRKHFYASATKYGDIASTIRTFGTPTTPLNTIDPASTSRNYNTAFTGKIAASHTMFDSSPITKNHRDVPTDKIGTPTTLKTTFNSAPTTRKYIAKLAVRTSTPTTFYHSFSPVSTTRNFQATPTALQNVLSSASTYQAFVPFTFPRRPTTITTDDDQAPSKTAYYSSIVSPVSPNQPSGPSATEFIEDTISTDVNSFTEPSRNLSTLITTTTQTATKLKAFTNEIITDLTEQVYAILYKLYYAFKSTSERTLARNTTLIDDSFQMSRMSTSLIQPMTPAPFFYIQNFYDVATELSSLTETYSSESDSTLVSSSIQIAEDVSVSIAVVDAVEHLSDFHEAKVYDPAPTYSDKDEDMNEEDSWKDPELASYYDKQPSGFSKIQTGILASCGVLAVAGIAIGIFVWRNRVYDMTRVPNKKQEEDFPGLRLFFNDSNSDSLIIDMEQDIAEDDTDLNIAMIEDLVMAEYELTRKANAPAVLDVPECDSNLDKVGLTLSASVRKLFGIEKPQEIDLEEANFISPLDLPPTQFVPFIGESPIKLISRAEIMENMARRQIEDDVLYSHYHF